SQPIASLAAARLVYTARRRHGQRASAHGAAAGSGARFSGPKHGARAHRPAAVFNYLCRAPATAPGRRPQASRRPILAGFSGW
nr:hypothetical protein [Tanacetum cinerariifolium]